MKKQLSFIAIATVLFLAAATYAHHPFSAEYDWTKPVTLTGTVTKLEWTNPHVMMHVDAKDDTGQMKQWTLEMGNTTMLTKAGWTRNMVKMGDTVTVEGWMSKTQKDRASVKSVQLPDGRVLSGGSSIMEIKPEKKPVSN
jgi:DNA/RNA endonuclease YhcR with UshA esterase domain